MSWGRNLLIFAGLAAVDLAVASQLVAAEPKRARRLAPTQPDLSRSPRVRGQEDFDRLAAVAEDAIGLPGFADFARAVAYRESAFNNQAVNEGDAWAAAVGYDREVKGRFAKNRYPRPRWVWGSGGWFGFLPTTALAAPGMELEDPMLVFEPAGSMAMFADYVRRIVQNSLPKLPPEQQTWTSVRRSMASLEVMHAWDEDPSTEAGQRARKSREKLMETLEKTGTPASFALQQPAFQAEPPTAPELRNLLLRVGLSGQTA
jgi:hypothetical protein